MNPLNKYEDISHNTFVIGAKIIEKLKSGEQEINTLYFQFQELISITKYFDVLTFLFITGIIYSDGNKIHLIDETNKALHNAD
jgi:hypothetical protein